MLYFPGGQNISFLLNVRKKRKGRRILYLIRYTGLEITKIDFEHSRRLREAGWMGGILISIIGGRESMRNIVDGGPEKHVVLVLLKEKCLIHCMFLPRILLIMTCHIGHTGYRNCGYADKGTAGEGCRLPNLSKIRQAEMQQSQPSGLS